MGGILLASPAFERFERPLSLSVADSRQVIGQASLFLHLFFHRVLRHNPLTTHFMRDLRRCLTPICLDVACSFSVDHNWPGDIQTEQHSDLELLTSRISIIATNEAVRRPPPTLQAERVYSRIIVYRLTHVLHRAALMPSGRLSPFHGRLGRYQPSSKCFRVLSCVLTLASFPDYSPCLLPQKFLKTLGNE